MAKRKAALAWVLAACLTLTGCSSLLNREYSTVEAHSKKYWESEAADTLRAETYQDIVNDLLLLVGQHTDDASVRLYNFTDDASVSDALERAGAEVQQETPLGAYAVDYITSESKAQRGYYELTIHIAYRRTADQLQSIVNATSTSALPDLLGSALTLGKPELVVRIGYWGEGSAQTVRQIVSDVRSEHGVPEERIWNVNFYPNEASAGIVEFLMTGQTASGAASSASSSASSSAAASGAAALAEAGAGASPAAEPGGAASAAPAAPAG